MYNSYKSPTWKSRAVHHSGIRTQRQISKRPTTSDPLIYFINPNYPFTGAPKNRSRRPHLKNIS